MFNSAYNELLALPEVERLLDIARSDNPLIALGVTKREVSWTRFLAWLLEPARTTDRRGALFTEALIETARPDIEQLLTRGGRTEDGDAPGSLKSIAALKKASVTSISSVKAESVEGAKGRVDLILECRLGEQGLTILVENKIGSEERAGQLLGYTQDRLAKRHDEWLLPMLMVLGDGGSEMASYPWAVVWNRRRVQDWLRLAAERCKLANTPVPRLVGDYMELFEAWDLAQRLRATKWLLLRTIVSEEPDTDEWKLLRELVDARDAHFFREVRSSNVFLQTLAAYGLGAEVYKSFAGRNDGLQATKPSWTIPSTDGSGKSVNVHYESRKLGELEVHVELHPYEGSLEKKGLVTKYRDQLALKTELTRDIRRRLVESPSPGSNFSANTKSLHAPEKPSAVCAVKFNSKPEAENMPAECAAHFAEVIKEVTPLRDTILAERSR